MNRKPYIYQSENVSNPLLTPHNVSLSSRACHPQLAGIEDDGRMLAAAGNILIWAEIEVILFA